MKREWFWGKRALGIVLGTKYHPGRDPRGTQSPADTRHTSRRSLRATLGIRAGLGLARGAGGLRDGQLWGLRRRVSNRSCTEPGCREAAADGWGEAPVGGPLPRQNKWVGRGGWAETQDLGLVQGLGPLPRVKIQPCLRAEFLAESFAWFPAPP